MRPTTRVLDPQPPGRKWSGIERGIRAKPRSGSDGLPTKGSGIERGFGAKPRSGSDGFRPKGSGIERGFGAKPRSGSDGFSQNPAETPPKTPPETPPPNARAGREPRNPQTSPPSPPDGGSHAGLIEIVENYTSDRGRKRQRTRVIDPNEPRWHLRRPGDADHIDWQHIRDELRGAVGDSTFRDLARSAETASHRSGGRAARLRSPGDARLGPWPVRRAA